MALCIIILFVSTLQLVKFYNTWYIPSRMKKYVYNIRINQAVNFTNFGCFILKERFRCIQSNRFLSLMILTKKDCKRCMNRTHLIKFLRNKSFAVVNNIDRFNCHLPSKKTRGEVTILSDFC